DAQDVPARGQVHAVLAELLERSPPSSAGNSDRPGDVHAVDLGVPAAVGEFAADESLDPPQAEHTYALELHWRRLIEVVKSWAGGSLANRRQRLVSRLAGHVATNVHDIGHRSEEHT